MKFRIALPGTHHIPAADDHIPEAAQWTTKLQAPDFHRILTAIDDLQYDAVTTSEHLGMPYAEVPRLGPYWMDALSVMAFIIGATRRVRVDTSVLVVPYHHPLALAKALSTMDVLSGGRLDVSVGVGHAIREFEVLGVSFADRGAITDETLEAMLELWRSDEPSFHGRHFDIAGLAFEPKPIQQPRPPIYVGGNSNAALRRAARYEGWQPNPINFSAADIPPRLDYLRSQGDFAGKERTFEICWVGAGLGVGRPVFSDLSDGARSEYGGQIIGHLKDLDRLGVTTVSTPVPITQSVDDYLGFIRWFDEEVITNCS
jgi:probable F420-dependent oxidoreductase